MASHDSRTPVGIARITAAGGKILGVALVAKSAKNAEKPLPVLKKTARELHEYFKGRRKHFSVPLDPPGTFFQKKVWTALSKIPYGKTSSYREIARAIGKPKSVRAVANAVGANPVCVLIPCHRVIGSDGALTGYAYGLAKKSKLLGLEGVS